MTVTALPGNVVPSNEPDQRLVSMLEGLTEQARSGYLRSFVGTGFVSDGSRLAMWGDLERDVYKMLGSITWLHAEYIHRHTDAL